MSKYNNLKGNNMKKLLTFILIGFINLSIYSQINPFHKGDVWVGNYECYGEKLDFKLVIKEVQGNTIISTFKFKDENGSFGLIGNLANNEFTFQSTHWIKKPIGYVTLGLHGFYLENPTRLIGNTISKLTYTEGNECTGFYLEKSN
jgi:hypothetical protein